MANQLTFRNISSDIKVEIFSYVDFHSYMNFYLCSSERQHRISKETNLRCILVTSRHLIRWTSGPVYLITKYDSVELYNLYNNNLLEYEQPIERSFRSTKIGRLVNDKYDKNIDFPNKKSSPFYFGIDRDDVSFYLKYNKVHTIRHLHLAAIFGSLNIAKYIIKEYEQKNKINTILCNSKLFDIICKSSNLVDVLDYLYKLSPQSIQEYYIKAQKEGHLLRWHSSIIEYLYNAGMNIELVYFSDKFFNRVRTDWDIRTISLLLSNGILPVTEKSKVCFWECLLKSTIHWSDSNIQYLRQVRDTFELGTVLSKGIDASRQLMNITTGKALFIIETTIKLGYNPKNIDLPVMDINKYMLDIDMSILDEYVDGDISLFVLERLKPNPQLGNQAKALILKIGYNNYIFTKENRLIEKRIIQILKRDVYKEYLNEILLYIVESRHSFLFFLIIQVPYLYSILKTLKPNLEDPIKQPGIIINYIWTKYSIYPYYSLGYITELTVWKNCILILLPNPNDCRQLPRQLQYMYRLSKIILETLSILFPEINEEFVSKCVQAYKGSNKYIHSTRTIIILLFDKDILLNAFQRLTGKSNFDYSKENSKLLNDKEKFLHAINLYLKRLDKKHFGDREDSCIPFMYDFHRKIVNKQKLDVKLGKRKEI